MRVSDWLRPMLRAWGRQRRRVLTGMMDARHVDGHASLSVSAYAEKLTRSGRVEQHFAEVYTGAGLEVWRALDGAPLEVREILHVHYVVDGIAAKGKAEALEVDLPAYYGWLRGAETWLGEKITALDRGSEAVST